MTRQCFIVANPKFKLIYLFIEYRVVEYVVVDLYSNNALSISNSVHRTFYPELFSFSLSILKTTMIYVNANRGKMFTD